MTVIGLCISVLHCTGSAASFSVVVDLSNLERLPVCPTACPRDGTLTQTVGVGRSERTRSAGRGKRVRFAWDEP